MKHYRVVVASLQDSDDILLAGIGINHSVGAVDSAIKIKLFGEAADVAMPFVASLLQSDELGRT